MPFLCKIVLSIVVYINSDEFVFWWQTLVFKGFILLKLKYLVIFKKGEKYEKDASVSHDGFV